MNIMMNQDEKSLRALAMLRYQATRYQAMGNGSMCQRIHAEIRKITRGVSGTDCTAA